MRLPAPAVLPLAALILAGATAPALAQRPSQIVRVDANGDGIITLKEFMTARQADFRKLDRNRDGRLSRGEFVRRDDKDILLRARRARRFDAMDRNGDGAVSRTEYLAFGRALFRRFDGDNDGRLTRAELRRGATRTAGAPSRSTGAPLPPPDVGRRASGDNAARSAFDSIDRDSDGAITRAELDRARRESFSRLDTNGDGKLTAAEVVILRGRGSERRFLQMDTNKDGVVTQAEFLAAGQALFRIADRNNDGQITFPEYSRVARRNPLR